MGFDGFDINIIGFVIGIFFDLFIGVMIFCWRSLLSWWCKIFFLFGGNLYGFWCLGFVLGFKWIWCFIIFVRLMLGFFFVMNIFWFWYKVLDNKVLLFLIKLFLKEKLDRNLFFVWDILFFCDWLDIVIFVYFIWVCFRLMGVIVNVLLMGLKWVMIDFFLINIGLVLGFIILIGIVRLVLIVIIDFISNRFLCKNILCLE